MSLGKESMADAVENEKREDEPKGPVDLNGEYRFKVDGKGRVSLPSKFRKVLSKDLVVARELEDQCLYVFETPDYNAWVEKLFVELPADRDDAVRMYLTAGFQEARSEHGILRLEMEK